MSRMLRCFAAASMLERADNSHPLAKRHRKRWVGGATADQQHGGVASGIGIRNHWSRRRIVGKPAHHGGMQCPDPQRCAKTRNQAIEIAAALRERNGVLGQRAFGIDRDQRKIGLPLRRSVSQAPRGPVQSAPENASENRGRLQLLDGA